MRSRMFSGPTWALPDLAGLAGLRRLDIFVLPDVPGPAAAVPTWAAAVQHLSSLERLKLHGAAVLPRHDTLTRLVLDSLSSERGFGLVSLGWAGPPPLKLCSQASWFWTPLAALGPGADGWPVR